MVILNNFWIIRKTILVYIGFSDYILGLSWYSDQDRSKIDPFKKYYLDPNRSILKQFLVENKYHGITGSFRPKILTFRVISWKKFSIIYLRDHLTVSRSGGYSLSISLKSSALRTLSLRILETFVLETFWRAAPSCSEIIAEDHCVAALLSRANQLFESSSEISSWTCCKSRSFRSSNHSRKCKNVCLT